MSDAGSGGGHDDQPDGVPSRAAPTRTLIIGPYATRGRRAPRASGSVAQASLAEPRSAAARLAEATKLAGAIDLDVVESLTVPVNDIRPATFIGSGKVSELAEKVRADG